MCTAAPVDTGLYMDVAHTSLRRALANQLTVSKQTVPHYSVSADVHVDNVLKLRERVCVLSTALRLWPVSRWRTELCVLWLRRHS
jgi:hypothetical protein